MHHLPIRVSTRGEPLINHNISACKPSYVATIDVLEKISNGSEY